MKLDINFRDVPDEIQAVEPGVYKARIFEEPSEHVKTKEDGSVSKSLKTQMVITGPEESPMIGRKITTWTGYTNLIGLKRILLSAGVKAGKNGLNTAKLVDATVTIDVQQDKELHKGKPTTSVRDFLIPSDLEDAEEEEELAEEEEAAEGESLADEMDDDDDDFDDDDD